MDANSSTNIANKIRSTRIYGKLLEIVQIAAKTMADYRAVDSQQATCVAILKLCNTDEPLRYFVYRYLVEFSLFFQTGFAGTMKPDSTKLRDMEKIIMQRIEQIVPYGNPVDSEARQGHKRNVIRKSLKVSQISDRLGWLPAFDNVDTNVLVAVGDLVKDLQGAANVLAASITDDAIAVTKSNFRGQKTRATSWSYEACLAVAFEMFVPLVARCLSADFSRAGRPPTPTGVGKIIASAGAGGGIGLGGQIHGGPGIGTLGGGGSSNSSIPKKQMTQSELDVKLELVIDAGRNDTIDAVIEDIFENPGPGTGMYATDKLMMGRVSEKAWARDVWEELQATYYSFTVETEDFFTLLTSLQYFASNIQTAAKQFKSALTIPTDADSRSPKQKELAFLVSGHTLAKSVLGSLSHEQLALFRAAKSVYRRRNGNDASWLPGRSWVWRREKELIKSLMNTQQFKGKKAENIRVLTVGLPRGLSKYLVDPLYTMGSGASSALIRENRLIEISVYRRDFEYEDIIFKPQTFLFDPFVFITNWDGMKGVPYKQIHKSMSFATKALSYIKYRRMQDRAMPAISANDHISNGDYPTLTDHEARVLFRNHATSYTLMCYYKLLFGLEIDEFGFFSNEKYNEIFIDESAASILNLAASSSTLKEKLPLGNVKWKDLVVKNVTGWRVKQLSEFASRLIPTVRDVSTAGETIPEELPPDISMEQALNFREVASSTLLATDSVDEKITAPRLFDRVFMIAVDPDDFVIDIAATWNNGSDAQALLKSDEWQNLTETVDDEVRIKSRRMNDGKYEFSDFFIQVALKDVDTGG